MLTVEPDVAGLVAPVVAACSGGADSLGLLVIAVDAGLDPIAVHVDHGTRPGGNDEAALVAKSAHILGVRSHCIRVNVEKGPNFEERARDARYAALEDSRAELGCTAILVAHTADDQAETVLLNLLRGAATSGLAGMPARRGFLARPALRMRRAKLRELVIERGLVPFEDPSNQDRSFRRNWIRHEVLPMLSAGAERDVSALLSRQATVLRSESDLLDELAQVLLDEAGVSTPSARVLANAHPALAGRAIRLWLGKPPPSLADVERVLAVARGECRATEISRGHRVSRKDGLLRHQVT